MLETRAHRYGFNGDGNARLFRKHWRGDQNIAQSILVNGVLFYLALETMFSLVYQLTPRPSH